MELADGWGLDAVTMQGVAGRIGVTPMALYRLVASKADLLDGLVELFLTELPTPADDLPQDEQLAAMADGLRQVARRHPAVTPLLLQRPATTPGSKQVRQAVYGRLAAAGVDADKIARVERLTSTAILGFLASEAGGRLSHHPRRVLDEDFLALQRMLGAFIADQSTGEGR